jgi:hypothetical protein
MQKLLNLVFVTALVACLVIAVTIPPLRSMQKPAWLTSRRERTLPRS